MASTALGLLENGHEDQAKAELQRALAADPANKLALNLMRQIEADPAAALGRESFPYVVQPNETMSMIANRFLGDKFAFYILARYNNIAVPRQVAGGQSLRIPARNVMPVAPKPPKQPPAPPVPPPPAPAPVLAAPVPPPEPTPAERAYRAGEGAERRGDLDTALAEYRRAATLNHPAAEAKAERTKKQLVTGHSEAAKAALARHDLDGAIVWWDRVLAIDPSNDIARVERQRMERLKGLLNQK